MSRRALLGSALTAALWPTCVTASPDLPDDTTLPGRQSVCNLGYYYGLHSPDCTIADVFNLEGDFDYVRLGYLSFYDATTPQAVGKASISPSAEINEAMTPTDRSGASLAASAIPVTFNNGGEDRPLGAQIQPPVTGAAVRSGGTGGADGACIVTVLGTEGARPPQLNVVISKGAITAVGSVADPGSVTYLPPNPVKVSGGGLKGASLTLATTPVLGIVLPPNSNGSTGFGGFSPNVVLSDWIACSSVPRTDGGAGRLLFCRTYNPPGSRLAGPQTNWTTIKGASVAAGGSGYLGGRSGVTTLIVEGGSNSNGFNAQVAVNVVDGVVASALGVTSQIKYDTVPPNPAATRPAPVGGVGSGCTLNLTSGPFQLAEVIGRDWRGGFSNGDAIADPHAFTGRGASNAVAFVQTLSRSHALTVMGIGDSIMQGNLTSGDCTPYGFRACQMVSTPHLPVAWFSAGKSGETSNWFVENAQMMLSLIRPTIVLVNAATGNDPFTPDAVTAGWGRAMQIANLAEKLGIVPILIGMTPQPTRATSPSIEAIRQLPNVWGAHYAASGGYFLQIDSILGDGANPASYQPLYDAGDHLHMSDAANVAVAEALVPLLKKIIEA